MSKKKAVIERPEPVAETTPQVEVVPVSKKWIYILLAAVVVPWIVVWGYSGLPGGSGKIARANSVAPENDGPATQNSGPWGVLVRQPIVISPPLEQVPSDWGPLDPIEWRFPGATRDMVQQVLAGSGLTPDQVAKLMAATSSDSRVGGQVVRPDPDLVRSMSPAVRKFLYELLAKTPVNPRQNQAYRFSGSDVDAWLRPGVVSPRLQEMIKPLIYQSGDFMYFADIDLIRQQVKDQEELHKLAKSLLRVPTYLVELRIDSSAQFDEIAEYWGRGGRRTDIRPLLESISTGSHQAVDISHLLPPLARLNLYRYPKVSMQDLGKSALANCFWTALNFFEQDPDNRLMDINAAVKKLQNDYFLVHDNYQLGDVVVFSDDDGQIFHVAVHLADDLVFTKNGLSPLSPWVIMPLERLKGYYVQSTNTWQILHYRRKDL